jgi:hypothetical protein
VSVDEKTGNHARDPKTLEIIVAQDEIVKANTFLKDNFPKVKWYELRRYYGYDITKGVPLVSDNSGVIYEINPETYKAERVAGSISNLSYEESTESTSISVDDKTYASLTGDPRKYIRIRSKEFQDLDFLKGNFLLSSSPYIPGIVYPEYYGPVYEQIELKQKRVDSLKKLLADYNEKEDKPLKNKVSYLEGEIRHTSGELERLKKQTDKTENKRFNTVVSPDRGFFIIHNTSASDTSKIMISKVIFGKTKTDIKLEWTTVVDNIFADPQKVFEKGGFEYVFSKGSPDLSTKRVVFSGDKLVYVSMLKAVCISMTDGKILWKIDV